MSRIGKAPIGVPKGVTVTVAGQGVTVKGKLGELKRSFSDGISVNVEGEQIVVGRSAETPGARALHGLTRALIANMVEGVSKGFTKNLDLVGTGYRVEQQGKNIVMQVGFSHPVNLMPLGSNSLRADGQVRLVVSGPDKELVGEQAARIHKIRPPNVYTGKGIKYENEVVKRKAGKTGPGTTGA